MPFDLGQILYGLLCLVSLPLWVYVFWKGQPFIKPRLRIQSPIGLLDVGILFLCWFVSQMMTVTILVYAIDVPIEGLGKLETRQELHSMGIASLFQLVATVIGLAIIAARHGFAPRIFGWQPENFWKDLRIGAIAFVLIVPVILTIQIVLTQFFDYEHITFSALEDEHGIYAIAITWISAVLVAPITEEIFFRGTFQAWLQRQDITGGPSQIETVGGGWTRHSKTEHKLLELEPVTESVAKTLTYHPFRVVSDLKDSDRMLWLPVFVSAFVFAGIHFGQGPAPIPLFVFAFALGYLYRQTGSIATCIVLHLLLNGFSMFIFTMQTLFETPVPV